MDELNFKWAQRLSLNKLKRLYESQAAGMLDADLLEDAAVTLYLRCKDIIAVESARNGKVRCPFCYANKMNEVYIDAGRDVRGQPLDALRCNKCAHEFSYAEYKRRYKREQLNMGGAGAAFKRYIKEYEQPAPPEKRMLQIDRLIHEFHYSLKASPEQPTRSVGPNLLAANLTAVMKFLNELSGMTGDNADMIGTSMKWREEKEKFNKMWNWTT